MKKITRRVAALLCAIVLLITSASALSVEDARELLEDLYVDELPPGAYSAATLEELFTAVGDPYTYYMTAEEFDRFNTNVEGETSVTGIGASIEYTAEGILLTGVLAGGGAMEAGLQAGDLIIAIDGAPCIPADETHRERLVGPAGTAVTITVRHAAGGTEDYRIQRRLVEIHNTSTTLWDGGVGYIDCDSFGSRTFQYFVEGIQQYDDDTHIWVVDMRSNTGGLLSAGVYTTGAFTGAGTILSTRSRDGRYRYYNFPYGYLTPDPVIVLTNPYSASAAEIFAAGIRDAGAGILIGSRTFGKGVAQQVFDSSNYPELFEEDAVKITVSRFYSAYGNTTDKIGVIPTLLMDPNLSQDAARLLSAKEPARPEGYLRLTLNGMAYYLHLKEAQQPENQTAFEAILTALPPDAAVASGVQNRWEETTVAAVADSYNGDLQSRWFTDLDGRDSADKINTLATYSILAGDGSGAFRPDDTLTRAQLCALMAQAIGVAYSGPGRFADVEDSRWYAQHVNAMAEMGLVNGTDSGTFRPGSTLTLGQLCTFMGRLAAYLNCNAYDYIQAQDPAALSQELPGVAPGLLSGVDAMTQMFVDSEGNPVSLLWDELTALDLSAPVTREQAAVVLYNLLWELGILSY